MFQFYLAKSASSTNNNIKLNKKQQVVKAKLVNKYPSFEWIEVPDKIAGKVVFKCHKGVVHTNNASGLLRQKYPCRICANFSINANKASDYEPFKIKVHKLNGHLLTLIDSSYISAKQNVKYICKTCNEERQSRGDALLKKRLYGCRNCSATFKVRLSNKIQFPFDSNKIFLVGSHAEYIALLYLKASGYEASNIVSQESKQMPLIVYTHNKQNRLYTPDFYIPSENKIIEVKGSGTITRPRDFGTLKLKHKACIKKGYNFDLMVIHRRIFLLKLPDNWFELTKKELSSYLSSKTFY